MKKLIVCLFATLVLFSIPAQSQVEEPEIHDELEDEPETDISLLKMEAINLALAAPKVSISIQPQENDAIVYHLLPGWTSANKNTAQVSVALRVKNEGASNLHLEKILFKYKQGSTSKSKTFLPDKVINQGATLKWQNSRKYHQEGEVLYLESPLPSSLTIELYFKNFPAPVVVTKKLKPYEILFGLPFKSEDLADNEHWSTGSTHGGGSQVFAYDIGVLGYDNSKWSNLHPGKDKSENKHYRVYGKPIYAMADGVVQSFQNNDPDNPKPGERAQGSGGGGNSFSIKHGEVVALYAHMQKGSLNDKLLKEGAIVKKGDFLGLAGNSGSSSGPHLHIHITKIGSGFRPLMFEGGYTIGREYYPSLFSTANWSELKGHGIPGFKGKRSFISTSLYHPYGDVLVSHNNGKEGRFIGVWKGSQVSDFVTLGDDWGSFTKKWKKLSDEEGLRLVDLDVIKVGNRIHYNGIFHKGTGKYALYQYKSWSDFTAKWKKLSDDGYRLIDIETFASGNNRYYVGVFEGGSGRYALYQHSSWDAFTAKWKDLSDNGQRLIDIETFKSGNDRYYVGVFREGNEKHALYQYAAWDAFTEKWKDLSDNGYRLIDIESYSAGDKQYYLGVWGEGTDSYALYMYNNWDSFNKKLKETSNFKLIDIEQVVD